MRPVNDTGKLGADVDIAKGWNSHYVTLIWVLTRSWLDVGTGV